MPRITRKKFIYIVGICAAISSILMMYPVILSPTLNLPLHLPPDIYLLIGLVILLFPPGILHLINVLWRRAIDKNIPKLLRQVAEAGRIGISIPKALELASQQDLGPLTPELKKAVTRLSWSYPMDKVLSDLMDDIGTPSARRAFTIIIEATKYGGDVGEMLMVLQRHLSGIQLTLRERQAMMRPYISYGYIAFFVFLAIQVILLTSFFSPILSLQEETQAYTPGYQIFTFGMTQEGIKTYFYHISLIEAFISGLVAGKMGEGSIFAGLKHVTVLLIATVLTYHLFV